MWVPPVHTRARGTNAVATLRRREAATGAVTSACAHVGGAVGQPVATAAPYTVRGLVSVVASGSTRGKWAGRGCLGYSDS
jgi:hypothetical protein